MRQTVRVSMALALLIGLFGATWVSADPVTITSGQAIAKSFGGGWQFNGDGLSATGDTEDGWSLSASNTCSPCSADHPITISFSSTCVSCVSHATTDNTLGGTVYPGPTTFAATLNFTGPSFSSSEVSADHLTFTAPFTMTGSLAAFDRLSGNAPPFYTTDLIGSGTATITFTSPVGGLFEAVNTTYTFAPAATPEPASLLLFGSGGALLWRRRRQQQAAR